MARKKSAGLGKIRTREHVIADLAVNHVERQVLLCGFTVEVIRHDYGIDLILFTYAPSGELESGNVFFQVKATEQLPLSQGQPTAPFRVSRSDLQGWLGQVVPVILLVYDASGDRALWLHVQGYFQDLPGFDLFQAGKTITLRLPARQILSADAVRWFGGLRDEAFRLHQAR